MDISWYIVQKMECFGTMICPFNKAGKCIFWPSGNPKTQNFPLDPTIVGPLGDTLSSN